MLLEFSFSNYKSFLENTTFSLTPAPKQKGLDYSIIKKKIGKTTYKGLSSAVLYGPNASGKSNVIGALDTLREIILRGHIRNDEGITPNPASGKLELIPNNSLEENRPVTFRISFIVDELCIEYSLDVLLGQFMDIQSQREVVHEVLCINGNIVFERTKDTEATFGLLHKLKPYVGTTFLQNEAYAMALAKESLKVDELFLTNGFKSIVSPKLATLIVSWFEKQLMVVYHADKIQFIPSRTASESVSQQFSKAQSAAAEAFGITASALKYDVDENNEPKLFSVIQSGKKTMTLPADIFESYGTMRFVNIFPSILRTLQTGGVLIIDEFDASIHPMAIMSLINIFHNDDINVNGAQLIFNTHNPIFLNPNLYRRDEIKFVERDEDSHLSKLYSLSDFSTAGKHSVRKTTDYMKNYFVNHYGAIKDVDFVPVVEALLGHRSEV